MKNNTVIIFGTEGRAVGSRRLSAFVDTLTTQFSSQLFFYLWIPQDSFTSFPIHHSLLFSVLKSSPTHKARMSNCSLRLFSMAIWLCREVLIFMFLRWRVRNGDCSYHLSVSCRCGRLWAGVHTYMFDIAECFVRYYICSTLFAFSIFVAVSAEVSARLEPGDCREICQM